MTVIYGSGYWLSIMTIYSLKFKMYYHLIPTLVVAVASQIYVVRELTLYERMLVFFGFQDPLTPHDFGQAIVGLFYSIATITDLIWLKSRNVPNADVGVDNDGIRRHDGVRRRNNVNNANPAGGNARGIDEFSDAHMSEDSEEDDVPAA